MPDLMPIARNIVNQLADAYGVPVEVRQRTNDEHDAWVLGMLHRAIAESGDSR